MYSEKKIVNLTTFFNVPVIRGKVGWLAIGILPPTIFFIFQNSQKVMIDGYAPEGDIFVESKIEWYTSVDSSKIWIIKFKLQLLTFNKYEISWRGEGLGSTKYDKILRRVRGEVLNLDFFYGSVCECHWKVISHHCKFSYIRKGNNVKELSFVFLLCLHSVKS